MVSTRRGGRITARFLEKELSQTVIVDNHAGAGGIAGSDLVSSPRAMVTDTVRLQRGCDLDRAGRADHLQ